VTVLCPRSKPPSARIERSLLYLQQFEYELIHIPGKDNTADVLSRLPVGQTQNEETSETEDFAYSVAVKAMPAALMPNQVEDAEADDTILQLVRQAIITGDWSRLSRAVYKAVQEELWVIGQVVLSL